MSFFYSNVKGNQIGFNIILNDKWSDTIRCTSNAKINSVFGLTDINNDDIIQKEDVNLLRKLLKIADNLIPDKSGDNFISDEEADILLAKIKNKEIDIDKLKQEATEEANKPEFPNAEDITSKIKINTKSGYDVKILNTHSQTEKIIQENTEPSKYNTYILQFHDPKTGYDEKIKFNVSTEYDEQDALNMISKIINILNILIPIMYKIF